MLSSSWKRFCVIVMLVFSTLQYLSAVSGDLLFEVGSMLESTTRYRYRYADHPWELIDDGQAFLELHNFHDDDFLVIQENTEGTAWDEERCYRFDGIERKWHAIQDPLLGIRLHVTAPDDSFTAFRYQTGISPSTEWKAVESGKTVIELPLFDPTTFLFLQQSKDGKDWGEVYRYQYDAMAKRWDVLPGSMEPGREPLVDVRLNVRALDTSYTAFRYQTGTSPSTEWESVESGKTVIELPLFDPTTFLFLQQSKDGKDWGEVYRYQYDAMAKGWNSLPGVPKTGRSITPYGMMLGTTESFHHLYEARYGGGVEYMQESPFHQQLLFAAELAASGASLNNIWIDNFLILEASLGLGYRIPLTRQLDLVPSVAYGMLVHMGTVDFANDGSPERVCYIDQQLRASLDLAWTITETMKMVIKPEAVVFFETNHIGRQYGFGAGLQFAL
ncbi:MAG: hypothetical protein EOM32_12620 [Spirochaetia bacterium]|nr:hypothetical protein [Spirochaetia bacterium]